MNKSKTVTHKSISKHAATVKTGGPLERCHTTSPISDTENVPVVKDSLTAARENISGKSKY